MFLNPNILGFLMFEENASRPEVQRFSFRSKRLEVHTAQDDTQETGGEVHLGDAEGQ